MNKEITLDYIAGLFDGEGCITIYHRNRNNSRQYTVAVSICNANRHILNEVKTKVGFGNVSMHKQDKDRPTFNFMLSNSMAYKFLILMKPYLRIKDKEAEIAIEFYENTINKFRGSRWDVKDRELKNKQRFELSEQYKEKLKNVRYTNYF